MLSSLEDVRLSGDIPTDTSLIAANGIKVETHALLCATISPVLRAALRQTSESSKSSTRTVKLDYASAEMLQKMLSFACGEFGSKKKEAKQMTGNDAMDLIQLADRLDMPPLHEACVKVLMSVLTSENAQDIHTCAIASNAPDLAAKARIILDARAHSHVIRSLHDKSRQLLDARVKKEAERKALEKELETLDTRIRNAENKIAFEVEKAYQKATAESSFKEDAGLGEQYPHESKRTLMVLPLPLDDDRYDDEIGMGEEGMKSFRSKRRKDIVKSYGPDALVYGTLDEAIDAALPGDIVRLQKGVYAFPSVGSSESFLFRKSIQIVGEKDGTQISTWNDDESPVIRIVQCDVRISNVQIVGQDNEDLVEASNGARVWLEDCVLDHQDKWNSVAAGINIHMGCSAFIHRCRADSITTSAVNIDPQAKEVKIDSCEFTRCGVGTEKGYDAPYAPGQSGAIEISCKRKKVRDSYRATSKVTIRNTTIASCFGPAVCYRVEPNIHWADPSRRRFIFPGSSSVLFESNTILSNGLALTDPCPSWYQDGEVLVWNQSPDVHKREEIK
mmetsp:Transcript_33382/g.73610  ORF Transcript_33382/g.73610 Transcript_33382/m.73610 type:complete len:561 (+) Transcript_33382:1282-2964(+)